MAMADVPCEFPRGMFDHSLYPPGLRHYQVAIAAAQDTLAGYWHVTDAGNHWYAISPSTIYYYRRLVTYAPDLVPLVWSGALQAWPAIHEAQRRQAGELPVCAGCYVRMWRRVERRRKMQGCEHTRQGLEV